MATATDMQQTAAFIKEHRSNEANFPALYKKLAELIATGGPARLMQSLAEAKEKAEAYKVANEKSGGAWPEFEKFVTAFERTVLAGEA